MKRNLRGFAAAGSLFLAMFAAEAAFAQKQGGILKMYSPDSPASMSIHEEATVFAEGPMMGVFNNLVSTTSTCRRAVYNRLCPIWLSAGPGTRTGPS
jgi:peptide/nickel transport system substrate-binding protein